MKMRFFPPPKNNTLNLFLFLFLKNAEKMHLSFFLSFGSIKIPKKLIRFYSDLDAENFIDLNGVLIFFIIPRLDFFFNFEQG